VTTKHAFMFNIIKTFASIGSVIQLQVRLKDLHCENNLSQM